jgi:hypothetical protein
VLSKILAEQLIQSTTQSFENELIQSTSNYHTSLTFHAQLSLTVIVMTVGGVISTGAAHVMEGVLQLSGPERVLSGHAVHAYTTQLTVTLQHGVTSTYMQQREQ